MASKFLRFIERTPMNRLVLTASIVGVIGSGGCIAAYKYSQYQFLKHPFCIKAIEAINQNEHAVKIIGPPIKISPPDLTDRSTIITPERTDFWLEFQGQRKRGRFRLEAERSTSEPDWILKRIQMKLDDLPNKVILLYDGEEQADLSEQLYSS